MTIEALGASETDRIKAGGTHPVPTFITSPPTLKVIRIAVSTFLARYIHKSSFKGLLLFGCTKKGKIIQISKHFASKFGYYHINAPNYECVFCIG